MLDKLLAHNIIVNESIPDNKIFTSNGFNVNFNLNESYDGSLLYMSLHTFTKLMFVIYKDDFDKAIEILCEHILNKLYVKIEYSFNVKYINYIKEL